MKTKLSWAYIFQVQDSGTFWSQDGSSFCLSVHKTVLTDYSVTSSEEGL